MQSIFMKMTGAQEQKMKCICWEIATIDFDLRRDIYLSLIHIYIEGFRLADKLSSDLIRHSSYPLLLLKMLESRERQSTVSNEEINSVLSLSLIHI